MAALALSSAPPSAPLSARLLRSLLYPPATSSGDALLYPPGASCVVLKSGSVFAEGIVTTGLGDGDAVDNQWAGRVLVTFGDASSAHIRPRNLIPCLAETRSARAPSIRVVTGTTDYYRRMAKACVRSSDFCVEIGSDFGVTTSILSMRARRAVGIDKSTKSVKKAKEQYPSLEFLCCDVFRNPESLTRLHEREGGVDVVFIDINGNRLLPAVQNMANLVERLVGPRIIVIKSKEMYKLLKTIRIAASSISVSSAASALASAEE